MEKKNNKLDKILSIAIWILLVLIFVLPDICNYHAHHDFNRSEQIYLLTLSGVIVSANVLSFVKAKRNNKLKGFGWEFSSVAIIVYFIGFFGHLARLLSNS